MNLYCVQHAEALPKEVDPSRPLSARGRQAIEAVAAFLAGSGACAPRRILHSGKTRAAQTAEALAARLAPPGGIDRADALEPLADPAVWAARCKEEAEDLMLVGHLPHMAKLASLLICGSAEGAVVEFTMGCVACLRRAQEGSWALRWMITPELVGR